MKEKFIRKSLILLGCLMLTGCDMSYDSWVRTNVALNIDSWGLKDTSKINVPFNLTISTSTDNSCVHDVDFGMSKYSKTQYVFWGAAIYENHGESCYQKVVAKDTTLSFSFDSTGRYYFYFKYDNYYKVDSILIIP